MSTNDWPSQAGASMNAFYGNPDADRNGAADRPWEDAHITRITPPYPMVLAWDLNAPVKSIRVHKRCAPSLLRALERILQHYGSAEAVQKARLHLYGGAFNFRLKRGGSSLSIHSWGAAIDLDPERNWFGRRYSTKAGMMPEAVVRIFEGEGWTWGGLWKKGDAMHFQAANI